MRRLLLVAFAMSLLMACAGSPPAQDTAGETAAGTPGPTPGQGETAPAPADERPGTGGVLDFTASTIDGGQLDASSLEGRDVVLWFWAPW
jgi:hypothetical protein